MAEIPELVIPIRTNLDRLADDLDAISDAYAEAAVRVRERIEEATT